MTHHTIESLMVLIEKTNTAHVSEWDVSDRVAAWKNLNAALSEVLAERDALAKDAARWKYWRQHHGWTGYFDDGASNSDDNKAIDAAIDAARDMKGRTHD